MQFDLDTFKQNFDKVTVSQLVMTVVAAVIFAGFAHIGFFFVTLVAVIGTFCLRDTLAPATGFWQHFPSWFCLCIATMLLILAGMNVPLAAWLSVLVLATITGLGIGRKAAKFFA